jgi:peptide/nickel transport system substrate-binding protein
MKRLYIVISLVMVFGMVLSACATATPETVIETVEVPVVQTQVVKETQIQTVVETVEVMAPTPAPEEQLPRNETLYFNGLQWNAVVGWNPYSTSMNNAWLAAKDAARVVMFETAYLYDMMDGGIYPLLADGDYVWNDAHTEITYKLKAAAHWSDGTPVTADDVAYTWEVGAKYSDNNYNNFSPFIDSVEAG